jgi:hypothetical protein
MGTPNEKLENIIRAAMDPKNKKTASGLIDSSALCGTKKRSPRQEAEGLREIYAPRK